VSRMPHVSVIVPCYNEEATIQQLLEAVAGQTYPSEDLEVIIADGLSSDRTREIISGYQEKNPDLRIRVVDNPMRNIPSGLNRALEAAQGVYIIRLDAHCIPYPDYIDHCLADLNQGLGDNVGGIWEIQPSGRGWVARSISAAAAHPIGAGDARYRSGGKAGEVETVPFGAYHKSIARKLGGYDERLLTNEDYEFNVRLREDGRRIWFDPRIRSIYFARNSFVSLARQYWRYGYWKARMLIMYPGTLRWRQLSALLVLSMAILVIFSLWLPLARMLFLFELAIYSGALLAAGLQTSLTNRYPPMLIGVPLAIGTMHFTWGTAFLWSLIQSAMSKYLIYGRS
jgi:succinoglycan biosynthesis protein ExoA